MDGDSSPDPYQALDLPKDATLPQIRSAHRKLVLKCHPDKYAEGALKAAKQVEFQRIQQAYELLSDKITRMDYEVRGMGRNNPTSRSNLFEVESSFPTAKPILKTHSRAPLPAGHTYTGEKQLSDGSISASLEDSSRVSPRFSRASAVVLRDWLSNHSSRPNPTDEEKENLKMQTGLNNTQITNWLTNARRRRMHSSPETAPRNPYDDSSSDDEYRPRISSASNGRSRREEEDRRLYAEGKRSGRTRGASYTENARTKDAKWNEHKDFAAQYMQAARKKANPVDEFRREPVASPDFRHESNYESQRRGSVITSDRPKLQRTKSSDSMDNSMRKMHHTMGSDYGGSEDEGYYRSRTTKRSRATSRQRSDSRNRAHSDAYEPPKQAQFVDVSEILSTSSRASPVTVSHSSQVADGLNGSAIRKLPPLKQAGEEDIQKAEAMAALGIRSHLRDAVDVPPSLRARATKECFCCLEAFPPSANAICLKCDHLWCSTCLSKLVRLTIDSRELWPPSCCSVKIPQMTLLDNIEESTNARYRLALQKKISIGIKCPRCWESFSDIRLVLHHHEEEHDLKNEMDTGKCISTKQSPIPIDVDSDDSTTSSSPRVSEASSPSTTMTEPDSDKETSPSSTSPSTSSLSLSKKAAQQWKMSQLPRIIFVFVTRAITHFLSLQTTAWFILVLAAVATSITTSYSLQGQVPEPPPEIGDSNYYSLLSQSIIAICSLYYLMVPYLRGDEELPVRALFYVCWTLSLCGAVTAPLIYSREWSKSVWCGFGSALAQVAATAFLFEHAGMRDRDRSLKRVRNETKVELQDGHDEEDDEEKYTDAVETHI